jgi:hypothetical protein
MSLDSGRANETKDTIYRGTMASDASVQFPEHPTQTLKLQKYANERSRRHTCAHCPVVATVKHQRPLCSAASMGDTGQHSYSVPGIVKTEESWEARVDCSGELLQPGCSALRWGRIDVLKEFETTGVCNLCKI